LTCQKQNIGVIYAAKNIVVLSKNESQPRGIYILENEAFAIL